MKNKIVFTENKFWKEKNKVVFTEKMFRTKNRTRAEGCRVSSNRTSKEKNDQKLGEQYSMDKSHRKQWDTHTHQCDLPPIDTL